MVHRRIHRRRLRPHSIHWSSKRMAAKCSLITKVAGLIEASFFGRHFSNYGISSAIGWPVCLVESHDLIGNSQLKDIPRVGATRFVSGGIEYAADLIPKGSLFVCHLPAMAAHSCPWRWREADARRSPASADLDWPPIVRPFQRPRWQPRL
jgi:hypothetical protein